MKKQLLLAGTLLCMVQADAQTLLKKHSSSSKHHELLDRILRGQSTNKLQQKPTGIQQRIVAQASEFQLAGTMDSATFEYGGPKGSTFDFNSLNYSYSTSFTNLYDPIFRYPGSDNPLNMLADSIKTYTDGELSYFADARYRSDHKIDSSFANYDDGSGSFTRSKDINSYNTQGALVKTSNFQELSPGVLALFITKTYTYNSTFTRVDRDSTWIAFSGAPELYGITTYHYTGTKLDSMLVFDVQGTTLNKNTTIRLTYNTAGKITTLKSYDHTSGVPVLSYSDTIGYTAGVAYMTFFQEDYFDETGTFTDGQREVKYVGSNGLPDSIRSFQREDATSGYVYFASLLPKYNAFNNPEAFYITLAMTGTDTVGRMSFYYDTWEDGLSIKPVVASKDFNVYPNPFIGDVNIDWKGKQPTMATLRLVNMAGQEVYRKATTLVPGKNTFSIPAVSSGNYMLLIQDAKGTSWSNKMIKK